MVAPNKFMTQILNFLLLLIVVEFNKMASINRNKPQK